MIESVLILLVRLNPFCSLRVRNPVGVIIIIITNVLSGWLRKIFELLDSSKIVSTKGHCEQNENS